MTRGAKQWAEIFREQSSFGAGKYLTGDIMGGAASRPRKDNLDMELAVEAGEALNGWLLEFLRRAEAKIGTELPSKLPFDPVGARGVVKWLRTMVPGGASLPAEPKS